ncbi:MAG: thiamine pyrophosphate-binding protein [Gammaproteobacteria bacterium]|nr:thiamine pyrophosphate-binding protein [Gammaproteobacteria bacterium]
MRAQQVFMESLLAHGVDSIFGNPGTTENSLLDRLADYPQISYYVVLHEGVAVGAANYYAQATGKTPVVNLHVAPGLGNAIGMMYGALKARAPMLVTAGQQDTRLRLREPLLSHDLVAMAAPVTKWSAEPQTPDEVAPMLRRAFQIASRPPAGPVFVSLPVNVMEGETEVTDTAPARLHVESPPDPGGLAKAVDMLLACDSPAIVTGDDIAQAGAFSSLVAFAETLGAPVWQVGLRAQVVFPSRHANYRGRLALDAAGIRKALAGRDLVFLLGGPVWEELWFDGASPLPDGVPVIELQNSSELLAFNDSVDIGMAGGLAISLDRLRQELQSRGENGLAQAAEARNATLAAEKATELEAVNSRLEKLWDARPMTPARALHEVARAAPDDVVIADESITASLEVWDHFDFQRPGDYYGGKGGGIGQGIAGAIGTKVAHPDRPVLAITGDGSAMYSIQALWTAAHHRLPIVFVILSNREYRVLKHNMDIYRHRFDARSNRPYPHMDLIDPVLGFVEMARGMGVDGVQVTEPEQVGPAIRKGLASGAPYLVDLVISGKV